MQEKEDKSISNKKKVNILFPVMIMSVILLTITVVSFTYLNVSGYVFVSVVLAIFFIMLMIIYFSYDKQQNDLKKALEEIESAREKSEKQLEILQSVADIYYSMHLIDLETNSAIAYEAKNQVKAEMMDNVSQNAADTMKRVMYATMSDSYLEKGLEFSDVTTLVDRMKYRKFISMDLLGKNVGWIRMLFITIEEKDGIPNTVICTTQIIDEEKKREERLIRESITDELTGCFNRRAYEDDILVYPDVPTEENFAYIAMDINGLKVINDTLGHDAGDRLILAAVQCMKQCIGNYGKIYRTGGDEFVAMIFADEEQLKFIETDFEEVQNNWHDDVIEKVSVSIGIVTKREFNDMTVVEMAKLADKRMYEAKANHYKEQGVDRLQQKI